MSLEKNNFKTFYALSFAWQLGFIVVIPIGCFIFLGSLGDRIFNTNPILLISGILIGVIVTVYEIYHLLMPLIKNKEE